MTNYEKHKDKIDATFEENTHIAVDKNTNEITYCRLQECADCLFSRRHNNSMDCRLSAMKWLLAEYKESEIDWSKVAVDTPVLVSDDGVNWERRYFVRKPAEAMFCVYSKGATSWSTDGCVAWYRYAKLWEVSDEESK